ncbi:MAG TPA: hypothetical protein VGR57_06640 [Ktedonobacterales bacterium]|nr:hypothetical protein [Ktedonobacterales bacterium]
MAWQSLEPLDDAAEREALAAREREALYPDLLLTPRAGDPAVVLRRERAESRLITVALWHGQLTPARFAAIGGFRLRQYALCGLYDAYRAAHDASGLDPSLDALAPAAIHVCSGTPDGRLLGYMCMETATPRTSLPAPDWRLRLATGGRHSGATRGDGYAFSASPRPLFATEFELFGPGVFASLPYLRDMPVARARELSRMLRNQVVASPLSVAAMLEITHMMSRLVTDPTLNIQVALGCLGREGRTLMAHLGVPLLLAPEAPVLPRQVALARATRSGAYWSSGANTQGQFWPFVLAAKDVRQSAQHFDRLDELLARGPADLRRGLVQLHHIGRMIEPETLLNGLTNSAIRWTTGAAREPATQAD